MSRKRIAFVVVTWLLAFVGGAWTMLLLFSSMMGSETGLILPGDLLWMLPFSIPGIVSSLMLFVRSRRGEPLLFWYWLLPAFVSGAPFLWVLIVWFDQMRK